MSLGRLEWRCLMASSFRTGQLSRSIMRTSADSWQDTPARGLPLRRVKFHQVRNLPAEISRSIFIRRLQHQRDLGLALAAQGGVPILPRWSCAGAPRGMNAGAGWCCRESSRATCSAAASTSTAGPRSPGSCWDMSGCRASGSTTADSEASSPLRTGSGRGSRVEARSCGSVSFPLTATRLMRTLAKQRFPQRPPLRSKRPPKPQRCWTPRHPNPRLRLQELLARMKQQPILHRLLSSWHHIPPQPQPPLQSFTPPVAAGPAGATAPLSMCMPATPVTLATKTPLEQLLLMMPPQGFPRRA